MMITGFEAHNFIRDLSRVIYCPLKSGLDEIISAFVGTSPC